MGGKEATGYACGLTSILEGDNVYIAWVQHKKNYLMEYSNTNGAIRYVMHECITLLMHHRV